MSLTWGREDSGTNMINKNISKGYVIYPSCTYKATLKEANRLAQEQSMVESTSSSVVNQKTGKTIRKWLHGRRII